MTTDARIVRNALTTDRKETGRKVKSEQMRYGRKPVADMDIHFIRTGMKKMRTTAKDSRHLNNIR